MLLKVDSLSITYLGMQFGPSFEPSALGILVFKRRERWYDNSNSRAYSKGLDHFCQSSLYPPMLRIHWRDYRGIPYLG